MSKYNLQRGTCCERILPFCYHIISRLYFDLWYGPRYFFVAIKSQDLELNNVVSYTDDGFVRPIVDRNDSFYHPYFKYF